MSQPIYRRTVEVGGDKLTVTAFDDGSIQWRVRTALGLGVERSITPEVAEHIASVVSSAVVHARNKK